MFKKIINLMFLLLVSLSLVACSSCGSCGDDEDNNDNPPVGEGVNKISVVVSTVPSTILKTEIESIYSTIKLEVEKNDGTKEVINLDKSMISSEDQAKLQEVGTQVIKVTYGNKETTLSLNVTTKNYLVRVLYPDNTPVTGKVKVQWCIDLNCFTPVTVNSNGYAELELADNSYYIHIDRLPEGYTYDPNAYVATKDQKYVEIKLIKLSTLSVGDGSSLNPFVVNQQAFEISFDKLKSEGMKYFTFTPTESGTYSIKSLAMEKLALNEINPDLYFLGTSTDLRDAEYQFNTGNVNFDYSFEAEQGVTYNFIIMVSTATKTPASFAVEIIKK